MDDRFAVWFPGARLTATFPPCARATPSTGLSLAGAVLALDVDGVLLDPGPDGTGSWQSVLAEAVRRGSNPPRLGVLPGPMAGHHRRGRGHRARPGRGHRRARMDRDGRRVARLLVEADFTVDHQVVEAVSDVDGDRCPAGAGHQSGAPPGALSRPTPGRSLLPVSGMAYSAALGFTKEHPQFFGPRPTASASPATALRWCSSTTHPRMWRWPDGTGGLPSTS